MTKKQFNKFNNEISNFIQLMNIGKENHYNWTINTIVGKLWITIHDDYYKGYSIYSVYCKFKDVKKAKAIIKIGRASCRERV